MGKTKGNKEGIDVNISDEGIQNNTINETSEYKEIDRKITNMTKRKVLANVEGFTIYSDTIYQITDRFDDMAPNGLQNLGKSKIPFKGNIETCRCPYDRVARVYDTGFYPESFSLKFLDTFDEQQKEMNLRIENIQNPYERVKFVDTSHYNTAFWDDENFEFGVDYTFNTSNPIDTMSLYMILLSGAVAPADDDGSPTYAGAMLQVEDKSNVVDFSTRRSLDKLNVSSKVVGALDEGGRSKQHIINILVYLGVIEILDTEDIDFIKVEFERWLDERIVNLESFMGIYNSCNNTDEGKLQTDMLDMYHKLVYLKNKRRIEVGKDGVYYQSNYLGADLKGAARDLTSREDMEEANMMVLSAYEKSIMKDNSIE